MKSLPNPFNYSTLKSIESEIDLIPDDLLVIYDQIIITKTVLLEIAEAEISNEIREKILLNRSNNSLTAYKSMLNIVNSIITKLDVLIFNRGLFNHKAFNANILIRDNDELRKNIYKNLLNLYNPDSVGTFNIIGNKMYSFLNIFKNYIKNAKENIINDNGIYNPLLGNKFDDGKWDIESCINRFKSQLIYSLTGDCDDDLDKAINNFKEININEIIKRWHKVLAEIR